VQRIMIVGGGSMSPTVQVGDRILVAPVDRPLRAGEVIVFHGASDLVCHRVMLVSRTLDVIVHRGDMTGARHGIIRHGAVGGRVVGVLRSNADEARPVDRELRLAERLRASCFLLGRLGRIVANKLVTWP
jgi:signal peptidase I